MFKTLRINAPYSIVLKSTRLPDVAEIFSCLGNFILSKDNYKKLSCIGLFGEIYFMEGELFCMSDCNTLCVLIDLTDHYDRWFEQVVEGGSADAGR